jgi:hypothetical protein
MNLNQRLAVAKDLLRLVQRHLLRFRNFGELGVTIILHNKAPGREDPIAIVTTLPSRADQRALLAASMGQCLMADGVTWEKCGEVATEDARAWTGELRNRSN